MGTPDFAVPALQALLDTQTVVGVVTQPDRPAGRGNQLKPSPVKVAALAAGLPLYQPESLRKRESAQPIAEWQPDCIIVAAFGQILRPHLLELPRFGCINLHASLLPRWRGASPIQHAILMGDSESGVCLMNMEAGLDTGAVYARLSTPIGANDTALTLHDRLAELAGQLIRTVLPAVLAGELRAVPQSEAGMIYAPMIEKADGRLRWEQSAQSLDRRIRAFTPWPGAWTTWQGETIKIVRASVGLWAVPSEATVGQVIALDDAHVGVVSADGVLQLHEVQLAGKKSAEIAAFVRGHPHFIGSSLI